MSFLRTLCGLPSERLQSRLNRYAANQRPAPAWLTEGMRPARPPCAEVYRDANGVIRHVRIGAWRVIAASNSRRIAEVRELACGRVAVCIQRDEYTAWELYDLAGHLLAMTQTLPNGEGWLETDFEKGEVTRMIAGLRLPADPRLLPPTCRLLETAASESLAPALLPCSG